MDIKNCYRSGSRSIRLGRYYEEIDQSVSSTSATANKLSWKVLWTKFKKEKIRKVFDPPVARAPYDPHTYSQNFDQGSVWDEADNLSRSFSVRFADPSRIFLKKEII